MKEKKTPRNAKSQVLDAYKKVGSTFVPPLVHRAGPMHYISWSNQTMPELIWWDVFADQVSNRFAAKVAEEIGKYFKDMKDHDCWWAFISDYSHLGEDDIYGLKEHMKRADVFDLFRDSLADFLDLYPECPISRFLDTRPTGIVDVGYLSRFENRMKELEHKRSRNAVLMQAQAVYMGFVLGRLHVKRGLALADFPEVQSYPTTERSKKVGASICATVNMLAGGRLPGYSEDAWVQYFWRRSLELRPLNFSELEKQ